MRAKIQKGYVYRIFSFFALLMFFTQQSMAVDKSIYYGDWKGKAGSDSVSLSLSKRKVAVEINNKKVIQPIKHEYTYSKISPYPFLSITFTDKQETEHLLYVVIGTGSKGDKAKLTGFYEKSRIIPNSHGKLDSVSEKIELIYD